MNSNIIYENDCPCCIEKVDLKEINGVAFSCGHRIHASCIYEAESVAQITKCFLCRKPINRDLINNFNILERSVINYTIGYNNSRGIAVKTISLISIPIIGFILFNIFISYDDMSFELDLIAHRFQDGIPEHVTSEIIDRHNKIINLSVCYFVGIIPILYSIKANWIFDYKPVRVLTGITTSLVKLAAAPFSLMYNTILRPLLIHNS